MNTDITESELIFTLGCFAFVLICDFAIGMLRYLEVRKNYKLNKAYVKAMEEKLELYSNLT